MAKKDERAEKLDACLLVIHGAQSRERTDILVIGEALTTAKSLLEVDATFTAWVEDECEFTRATAYNYMNVWQVWADNRELVDRFSKAALYLLSRESTPQKAIHNAILHAKRGRKVTLKLAEEIISVSRPKPDPVQAGHEAAEEGDRVKRLTREDEQPAAAGKKGIPFDPDTAQRPEPDEADGSPAAEEESFFAGRQYEPEAGDPIRPFARLVEFPDDFAEALESLKLSILRHRLAGWVEMSPHDVIGVLVDLKRLTVAPVEQTA